MKRLATFGTRRYTKREVLFNKISQKYMAIGKDFRGHFVALRCFNNKEDAEVFLKGYRKPIKKKKKVLRGKHIHDYKNESFQGNSF